MHLVYFIFWLFYDTIGDGGWGGVKKSLAMLTVRPWAILSNIIINFLAIKGVMFFLSYLGFTHFEPSQSLRGAKTGDPREKTT